MSNRNKLFLFIGLFLISLLIGLYSAYRYTPYAYYLSKYTIQLGNYSFSINSIDSSKQVLRVSPFDDYFYHNDTKDHPISPSDFKKAADKTNILSRVLSGRIFSKTNVSWEVESNSGVALSYGIENLSPDEIKITRTVKKSNYKIDAIGQSIVLCQECLVVDDKARVFFTPELLTAEKFALAQSLKLSPVILVNNLIPSDTEKLIVIDKDKNQYMTLSPKGHLEIYYYEKWQLLEFKTWLGDETSVSQTVNLE